ncbi:hypothetical protein D3C78_1393750 [compost metagenome]
MLIGRGGGCCVTEWGIGIGNCHGVFLLVQVAASNVDTHIAAAAIARSAHHGRVCAAVVIDPVIVAVLPDVSGGSSSAEHEAVIEAGVGGSVCDGGRVVLLVAGACCHVDADVAAGACGRAAHFGFVLSPFVADAVAGTALPIVRLCSRVDRDLGWRRSGVVAAVMMAIMVTIATRFVLPSLYSNSHDRSNCENQRLECHRGFHGDSPYFILG